MRIYESLSFEEVKTKIKPVVIRPRFWTFGTTISQVLECQITHSGNYVYRVKLRDGKVIKVAEDNIPKRYKHVAKRLKDMIEYDMDVALHQTSPTPRKKRQLTQKTLKKKYKKPKPVIRSETSEDDPMLDTFDHMDDNDDDYTDTPIFFEDNLPAPVTTTQSGRRTVQPKFFEAEFHSEAVSPSVKLTKKQPMERTFHIPRYTDESFKDHHSKFCLKCHQESSKDGPVIDVSIGYTETRSRFLLCNYCSLAFHNNCVNLSSINIQKESGILKCHKCLKSGFCFGCNESLFAKEKAGIVPLRCSTCFRAFHFDCIATSVSSQIEDTIKVLDAVAIYEPSRCLECTVYLSKSPERIIAERQVNNKTEYLMKWKGYSYRKAEWVVASWAIHACSSIYRTYTKKKAQGKLVPFSKEWLVIDRILDVTWDDDTQTRPLSVLAVFKDRDYAEAVWDDPPTEKETDLYPDYEIALKRYIQSTHVLPPANMKALISQVRTKARAEKYEKHELKTQPKFIAGGSLMKHQMEALNWLLYQWELNQSCVLADDMGLGKTIQIVSFLYYLFKKYSIYPFFIVVPNSTATNWIREFQKWAPDLVVAPYFGSKEARRLALTNEIFDAAGNLRCHAVVNTYESALERTSLSSVFWPVMIVDESQRLKNDESLLFKTLNKLHVDHTVLLTGTPLQNNLRELFNIMNFIHPKDFKGNQAEEYEELNASQVEELHARLRPHFLRRTKEEVLKTLPPKYELIVPVTMTSLQKEVYKQCLSGEIHDTLAQATMAKKQHGLNSIFVNLRKVLNHPYLLDGVETSQPTLEETHRNMINASAKLKLFHQMLPKLIERGHRMLVFSTMTRTLDILEDYFAYENILYARIDGSTKERERVRQIDAFNAPDSKLKVFLLSTRAGGVGINLATADTVIIWDSDFNPYADFQAISRAHRIGQTKMVLTYRLMTRFSVEEKVLQIAKKRIALEHVIVEKMNVVEEENLEDIESILKHGTEALFSDDNQKNITYDAAAIENLLDREQYIEEAERQQQEEVEALSKDASENTPLNFAFAKVWQSDGRTEELPSEEENEKDADFWEKFLEEQHLLAEKKKEEKRLAELNLGRGARKRANITYNEKILNGAKGSSGQVNEEKAMGDDKDGDYVVSDNEAISESELDVEEPKKITSENTLEPHQNNLPTNISNQPAPVNEQHNSQQQRQGNYPQPMQIQNPQQTQKPLTFTQYRPQQQPQQPVAIRHPRPLYRLPNKMYSTVPLQGLYEQGLYQQEMQAQGPNIQRPPAQRPPAQGLSQQGSSQQRPPLQGPSQQAYTIQADIPFMQAQNQSVQQLHNPYQQHQQGWAQHQQQQNFRARAEQAQQIQQREMESAINFYKQVNYKSLVRWIDERVASYKDQSQKNIEENTFNISLFIATRHALIEDIKNTIFDRSKANAEFERQSDSTFNFNPSVSDYLYSIKLKLATQNISLLDEYIRSEVDKLITEVKQMAENKQQQAVEQLNKLQALVQKQEAERRAFVEKQKKELFNAASSLLHPTQLSNLISPPTRQTITYNIPQNRSGVWQRPPADTSGQRQQPTLQMGIPFSSASFPTYSNNLPQFVNPSVVLRNFNGQVSNVSTEQGTTASQPNAGQKNSHELKPE